MLVATPSAKNPLALGFDDLEAEVIVPGRCTLCGACVSWCAKVEIFDYTPRVKTGDYCSDCLMCYDHCPRSYLPAAEIGKAVFGSDRGPSSREFPERHHDTIGTFRRLSLVQSADPTIVQLSQSGGAVTSILSYALETGLIDATVVTGKNGVWEPKPFVGRTRQDVVEAAGNKFSMVPLIPTLREAIFDVRLRTALVGVPCHIQAARKIQMSDAQNTGQDKITYLIGLFCWDNFSYHKFMTHLAKDGLSIDPTDIAKVAVERGRIRVQTRPSGGTETKTFSFRVPSGIIHNGCLTCTDFTAELADISVGDVSAPYDGEREASKWSAVIARSERGLNLLKGAEKAGYIRVAEASAGEFSAIASKAMKKVDKATGLLLSAR